VNQVNAGLSLILIRRKVAYEAQDTFLVSPISFVIIRPSKENWVISAAAPLDPSARPRLAVVRIVESWNYRYV
jgi:hypothetical protein